MPLSPTVLEIVRKLSNTPIHEGIGSKELSISRENFVALGRLFAKEGVATSFTYTKKRGGQNRYTFILSQKNVDALARVVREAEEAEAEALAKLEDERGSSLLAAALPALAALTRGELEEEEEKKGDDDATSLPRLSPGSSWRGAGDSTSVSPASMSGGSLPGIADHRHSPTTLARVNFWGKKKGRLSTTHAVHGHRMGR